MYRASPPARVLSTLAATGASIREERARILRRTAEATNLIRKHTHDPTQMTELVRSSILTIFQYSCAFVNWSLNDLDEVGKLCGVRPQLPSGKWRAGGTTTTGDPAEGA